MSEDPALQRAIYASIQSARAQGYSVGKSGGGGGGYQGYRSSSTYVARSGGPTGGGGGSSWRPSHAPPAAAAGRNSQSRPYGTLPGVGAGGLGGPHVRASHGRIDTLRRDGIAPASSTGGGGGGAFAAVPPSTASYRSLPVTSPSRRPTSPSRRGAPARGGPAPALAAYALTHTSAATTASASSAATTAGRNAAQHQRKEPHAPAHRQPHPHGHAQQQQQGMPPLVVATLQQQQAIAEALAEAAANPVMASIAAATAEAHAAFEAAVAAGLPVTAAAAAAAARQRAAVAAAAPVPVTALPAPSPAAAATTAAEGGSGDGARPVGGNAPPPRALVAVTTGGGGVEMVPDGVDPALAQMVLRDAVTWDTGVTFADIAGCERAKQLLHEAVALPLIIPEFFTGIREPWRGVLLHGPPGTGKTLLAKAVAGMVGGAFFAVSPSSLTSKWRGESERLLAALFAVAAAHAPAIIFIDEVDALGGARGVEGEHEASRRFKAELLQQMDGLSSGRGVMVLAATNCPWDLDPALRRRLEKRVHIGLPDEAARLALLRLHLRGVALAPDVDLPALAAASGGLSGADVKLLCRDAAMAPLRRHLGTAARPPPPSAPAPRDGDATCGNSGAGGGAPGEAAASDAACPPPQPPPAVVPLRSAADIRRLADSGELARRAVVSAADLAAALAAVRPSVSPEQAARYEAWDREFASV